MNFGQVERNFIFQKSENGDRAAFFECNVCLDVAKGNVALANLAKIITLKIKLTSFLKPHLNRTSCESMRASVLLELHSPVD